MNLSEAKELAKNGSLSLDQIPLEFRADQEVVLNALSRSRGKYSGRSALALGRAAPPASDTANDGHRLQGFFL